MSSDLNEQRAAWHASVEEWSALEETAEAMIPLIGSMYRTKNVVTTLYGRGLVNRSATDVVKLHNFAKKHLSPRVTLHGSLAILRAVKGLPGLRPTRLDLGHTADLCAELLESSERPEDEDTLLTKLRDLLRTHIAAAHDASPCPNPMEVPRDVVLYGFGRIGRLVARILIEKTGGGGKLALRAIVVRKGRDSAAVDLAKRASLLRRDSVHGPFAGVIQLDEAKNQIIANGVPIQVIHAEAPDKVDYAAYGISDAIVVDNTGVWRTPDKLALHLASPGVSHVLLTAPASKAGDAIITVVAGINDDRVVPTKRLFSGASCTTNAICPVLKVVDDAFGIVSGHVETVHSYTNDQHLIDNYHSKERRGRSAVLNMVITETGAAEAVSEALPELHGKMSANAIRVPTPDVSLAIMSLQLRSAVSKDKVNDLLKKASLTGPLMNQIDYYSSPEVVSSDFVGNRHASIVDSSSTIVHGDRVNLYVWYDNEFGYSAQMVRVVQRIAGIVPTRFPPEGGLARPIEAAAAAAAAAAPVGAGEGEAGESH